MLDVVSTPEELFLVMEYIDGYTLEDLVVQFGSLPPGRAVHLARAWVSGVADFDRSAGERR